MIVFLNSCCRTNLPTVARLLYRPILNKSFRGASYQTTRFNKAFIRFQSEAG